MSDMGLVVNSITPTAVLFDLDGTLLDSAPDLVGTLNWLRAQDGLPELDLAQMSRHASRGAGGLLNAGHPSSDPDEFERRRIAFIEHYGANSFRNSRLYEGIDELIDYLNGSGVPWGVVTNKMESLTLPILEASGLARTVSCVVCGDTTEFSKPHPAPVLLACEILGVNPGSTLFVGDDIRDVDAGKAAGTMTAAVLYGYGSDEFSETLTSDSLVLKYPTQLMKILSHNL